jgi:hypothetical protein
MSGSAPGWMQAEELEPILVCDLIIAFLISAALRRHWDPVGIAGVIAPILRRGGQVVARSRGVPSAALASWALAGPRRM